MANDISLCNSNNPIKNGTFLVISSSKTGKYSLNNTYVNNTPVIADIQAKYDARFDDPSYYYGIGNNTIIGG
jgi:hypothetical protein